MRVPVVDLLGAGMNAPDMRTLNGIQILNLIREQGPLSRAALAKLSGLSKPTVSEQVARLVALDFVIETGPGESAEAGGKRPTLVAFNTHAGYVAGVAIAASTTRIALADLQGTILDEVALQTAPEHGPGRLCGRIERALDRLAARSGKRLSAVGIGAPGRVDAGTGVVLESGSVFLWRNVDLRSRFEHRLGCRVLVDNDVNAGLLAELHRGSAQDAETAVLLRAGTGIGSAVAIGRTIHHGSNWAAGEIGHLSTGAPASARWNPRGHLESILGADQIARRVRSAAAKSVEIRRLLRDRPPLQALYEAAAEKDRVARALAAELSGLAATAVANQALAYDPDVVLLSGELFSHSIADIRKFLERTVPWSANVQMARFGEEGVRTGAVDMALAAAYEQMARTLAAGTAAARAAGAAGV